MNDNSYTFSDCGEGISLSYDCKNLNHREYQKGKVSL